MLVACCPHYPSEDLCANHQGLAGACMQLLKPHLNRKKTLSAFALLLLSFGMFGGCRYTWNLMSTPLPKGEWKLSCLMTPLLDQSAFTSWQSAQTALDIGCQKLMVSARYLNVRLSSPGAISCSHQHLLPGHQQISHTYLSLSLGSRIL